VQKGSMFANGIGKKKVEKPKVQGDLCTPESAGEEISQPFICFSLFDSCK
jgi:hypothetical protein